MEFSDYDLYLANGWLYVAFLLILILLVLYQGVQDVIDLQFFDGWFSVDDIDTDSD